MLPFAPSDEALEQAWERHRTLAAEAMANPTLITDRKHMEARALAENEFKRMFLRANAAMGSAQ